MLPATGQRRALLFLLLLVGPLAGVWTYLTARPSEADRVQAGFEEHLAKRATALEMEVGRSVEMLHYLAALYQSSELVTPDEFARFTRSARQRHPRIHAVQWAPRVLEADRDAHVARMHDLGLSDYDILHVGEDGRLAAEPPALEAYPVTYVEPMEGNEGVLGFDLASETSRREAIERAVATRQPQLTDPVRLVQEDDAPRALLMFLPVCAAATSVAADPPVGVVTLVWRAEDLFPLVLGPEAHRTLRDVRVEIKRHGGSGAWLYLVSGVTEPGAAPTESPRASVQLSLAGRPLRLTATASPQFVERLSSDRPLLLGSLAFLLGSLLAVSIGVGAARIERTREDARLRLTRTILRSLDQGVVVADADGQVQFVNEAAQRMVGSLADTMARRGWAQAGVGDPVGLPGAPEAMGSLPLGRAMAGGHFEDEEYHVRSHAAPEGLWVRVSGAPLRDTQEEVVGGVVVFRDVTEAKEREDSIRRLTAAVDQSADAIFITEVDGRILYVNSGFEQTTGFRRRDAIGATPRLLRSGVHDADHYRRMWDTILRGEVWRGTVVNRKQDGTLWYGDQSITPIRDTQGLVTHFVSVTKDMTEKKRLEEHEAEVRMAGIIQKRLYPATASRVQGLEIAGAVYPAGHTCGDYFDVLPLSDGTWTLAVGDVSGHGIGPALIMVETRAHLRSQLIGGSSVRDTFTVLNRFLCEDIPDDRFVSLLMVRFDPLGRTLQYVNAGHPAGLLVGADGEVRAQLAPTGPALGVIQGARFRLGGPLDLREGDVLVLLTDGITEVRTPDGDLFEAERVLEVVREHRSEGAQAIVESLYAAAGAFACGRPLEDDLTLLVAKVETA